MKLSKNDPNFQPYRFIYLILVGGAWAQDRGYVGGVGAWMKARHFQCYPDVKRAIDNPQWHNDPEGIARGQVVSLVVSVEPKLFPIKKKVSDETGFE